MPPMLATFAFGLSMTVQSIPGAIYNIIMNIFPEDRNDVTLEEKENAKEIKLEEASDKFVEIVNEKSINSKKSSVDRKPSETSVDRKPSEKIEAIVEKIEPVVEKCKPTYPPVDPTLVDADDWNDEKLDCLNQLKDSLLGQELTEKMTLLFDDWFQLRFCRAQNFEAEKVIVMFEKYVVWRKEKNVDNIIQQDFSAIDKSAHEHWKHGYFCVSKTGAPVYIEKYGKNIKKMLTPENKADMEAYLINSYEYMIHVVFPACSKLAGRRIDKIVTILDLDEFGFGAKVAAKSLMNIGSEITKNYYPCLDSTMLIINTGFMTRTFLSAWSEPNRHLFSSDFKSEVEKYVDFAEMPKELKGDVAREIYDDQGPWVEYGEKCKEQGTYFVDREFCSDPWKHL